MLHTLRSTKVTIDGVVDSERGELAHHWRTVLTLRPAMCGGRRPGFRQKNILAQRRVEKQRQKLPIAS